MSESAQLNRWSLRQGGVFTREQAKQAGYTTHQISHRLESGVWRRFFTGHAQVLVAASTPAHVQAHVWAALLVVGAPAALALDTAAWLWGWCERPCRVTVVTPAARRPRPPREVRVLRSQEGTDHTTHLRGLCVTDQARTLAECLRWLPRERAQRVLDRSQQRSGPTVRDVAALLPARGPGTGGARALLAAADGTVFAAERLLANVLRRGRISGWQANAVVIVDGRRFVVDVLFARQRVVVEVDGWAFHHAPDRFVHDRRRQNALVNAGWTVLRFSYADLVERPDEVLDVIRRAVTAH